MIAPETIATGIIGAFVVAKEVVEYFKRKKYGLNSNPKRCKSHAEAINAINDRIDNEICPDLEKIKDRLGIV